jgi:hypothetical protein
MRAIIILLGLIGGGVLGTVLGIAITWGFVVYVQWQNPNDPTAGSVAILGMFIVPNGSILGAVLGAGLAARVTRTKGLT